MKLLLHCCCAPCSGAIIEKLVQDGERPVLFFSNSNIFPYDEYALRRAELQRYASQFGLEVVDDLYDHQDWLSRVRGLEDEPERGKRCALCFRYRLSRAARYAEEKGFDRLATTLASSRWKNLDQVNAEGVAACAEVAGVEFWEKNWRKGGLQERRNEIVREQNFYNQNFCGCEFSQKNL